MDERTMSTTDQRDEMSSVYDASAAEERWYPEWERRGYFAAKPNTGREPYSMVMPPPNVTGALHMGHALNIGAIQDTIVRRKRMQGYETLWLPGTDHAGIATQVVVERELAKEGIERRQLGREKFLERVWAWKQQYGNTIIEQIKKLGSSCDWTRLRFTMDEGLARAVRTAFVQMYGDGLIYRGERIVNWCPRDTTALSDSEVNHEDVAGELVTFRYDLTDGSGHLDVATTRVETMLGDTGVAVHPDDERHRGIVGKSVRHPFTGESLPIVADQAVDPEFGTGALKITAAHDPMDFEIAQRHGLPLRNILTAHARISDAAPEEFRGLDRYEARGRVLERLREMGKVVEVVRPYIHAVGHCYRCNTEIEPWLSGKQWFVSVERLKGPAKKAALDGRIRFWPERWSRPYVQWLDGLRDWNISRQLWWGHRIPVWYCPKGHEFAALEDPDGCEQCGSKDIEQDADVLDTWFSSQLWPFSTLGWPEQTEDLEFFYPTSVLVTGYEILYLWVTRMVMSGLYFMKEEPFRDVVITGLVRDRFGKPMHKSSGNVVDPLDLIAKYGADAVRFGLLWMATGGQDIPLAEETIEAARRFANKIWNAGRLVLSVENREGPPRLPAEDLWTVPDRWLLSRHQACLAEVDRALDEFRFAEAVQTIHRFFWSEFCDWGLEAAKPRLYGGSEEERRAAGGVLCWILERTLRMLHPIMPFVTEEIWQRFGVGESIMVAAWPGQIPGHRDEDAERSFGFAEEVVTAIRRFRKAHGLKDTGPLAARIHPGTDLEDSTIAALRPEIERLATLSALEVLDHEVDPAGCAVLAAGQAQLLVALAGVLDPEVERARLRKGQAQVEAERARVEAKLANPDFLAKAPREVVEKERGRLAGLDEEAAALRAQLEELG